MQRLTAALEAGSTGSRRRRTARWRWCGLSPLVGDRAKLMIKIDSQALLDQLDAVLELADGRFGRGDLGSSIPVERISTRRRTASRPRAASWWSWPRRCWSPWSATRPTCRGLRRVSGDLRRCRAVTLSAETAGAVPHRCGGDDDRLIVSAEADDPDPGRWQRSVKKIRRSW